MLQDVRSALILLKFVHPRCLSALSLAYVLYVSFSGILNAPATRNKVSIHSGLKVSVLSGQPVEDKVMN
jgi:hypothetical protein